MKGLLHFKNILFILFCTILLYNIEAEVRPRGRSRTEPGKDVLNQQNFIYAIKEKINNYNELNIPHHKRVLVLYHVGILTLDYSMDVIINNIKIFCGAVLSHVDSTYVEGLYVFNILGGENNPFYKYLPCDSINVICIQLSHSTLQYETIVDIETHSDVVTLLGDAILKSFNSILFMFHEARGPFDKRNNGEWLTAFTNLINQPSPFANTTEHHALFSTNNNYNIYIPPTTIPLTSLPIGAVSTGMSCEVDVRLLTYTYMLSSSIVTKVFQAVALYDLEEEHYHNRTELLGAVMTSYILKQGISIASLAQQAVLLSLQNLKNTFTSNNEFLNTTVFNEYDPNQLEETSTITTSSSTSKMNIDTYPVGHPEHRPEGQPDPVGNDMSRRHRQLSLFHKEKTKNKYQTSNKMIKERMMAASIYQNQCVVSKGIIRLTTNNNMWCSVQPIDMLFIRYGGSVLRTPGILCPTAIDTITNTTIQLAYKSPTLHLRLPELLYGGIYRELYRQYMYEEYRYKYAYLFDTHQQLHHTKHSSSTSSSHYKYFPLPLSFYAKKEKNHIHPSSENVCFLVRTAQVHSQKVDTNKPISRLVKMDLTLLIKTLIHQTSPHWRAYFIVTDDQPFEAELKEVLKEYKEDRLQYLDIPMKFRPVFTTIDAGYTATDYALSQLLKDPQCKYISVSNADNAYGSHLVQNVLYARPDPITGQAADMVLAPLDSRNLAEQDYLLRAHLRGGKSGGWRERCVGVETSLKLHLFVYTIQTLPILGRVDLAAVFFNSKRLAEERMYFSNFSDVSRFPCKGCQDGYLTETLVTQRFWTYSQLPIDGLKSMVFHGPSPTLCIASGNVWFDFPEVNKLGCVSHSTIGALYPSPLYDLARFYDTKSARVCLRLSQKGFWNRTASVIV